MAVTKAPAPLVITLASALPGPSAALLPLLLIIIIIALLLLAAAAAAAALALLQRLLVFSAGPRHRRCERRVVHTDVGAVPVGPGTWLGFELGFGFGFGFRVEL